MNVKTNNMLTPVELVITVLFTISAGMLIYYANSHSHTYSHTQEQSPSQSLAWRNPSKAEINAKTILINDTPSFYTDLTKCNTGACEKGVYNKWLNMSNNDILDVQTQDALEALSGSVAYDAYRRMQ